MSHNYSGNPANVTTPLTATITNCTSGSGGLVEVTTSTSHLFSTYDYVTVNGVLGTTEANVTAQIQVVDSTHFLLDGTTFVNTYSSGGTATDISLTPYFQIPDDGEAGTVQSIEASIQCLADRTQYLMHRATINSSQTVTTSGNVTVPANCSYAYIVGCGGGGGGGGGTKAAGGANVKFAGGGGGGGAQLCTALVPVTPGATVAVTIGAGGTAGTGGLSATAGGNGGDTTFGTLATFLGANGGGTANGQYTTGFYQIFGGTSVRSDPTASAQAWVGAAGTTQLPTQAPGQGGASVITALTIGFGQAGVRGAISMAGSSYAGGAGGTMGTADSSDYGGAGGGGGGGGPYGVGCNGGNGGNGNASGNGTDGTAGSSAGANTGAGGGGGGGGGCASGTQGNGGAGGAGGSGQLTVYWLR